MDWARILAYVTGTVDQELLAHDPERTFARRYGALPCSWQALITLRRGTTDRRRAGPPGDRTTRKATV
jgi:hypothetical protein